MKRVLVTGAGGFVGARILDMWRGKFALCAFPSDTLRTADENVVLRFILKEHPDVIVHTAALSNTQYCQQEPEDSFRANVLLPEWVAKGAEEVGAKLLSCSSDQVYAGVTQRGALAETLPRQLSPQDREVLLWRFEQGLDYDEIANLLGISEAGGRSRVSRAVRRCRALWDGSPRKPEPKQT